MHKSVPRSQTVGFLFVSVFGTGLHFLFDLTGQNPFVASFSAVNESIWEHLKLLYFPMALFALWQYRRWGHRENRFWQVKLTGIATSLVLVPILYYTYTGIFGRNADWLNITIFFVVAAMAFYLETKLFQRQKPCHLPDWAAVTILSLLAAVFVLLTFFPPHIPFFRDPATGSYGYHP